MTLTSCLESSKALLRLFQREFQRGQLKSDEGLLSIDVVGSVVVAVVRVAVVAESVALYRR